MKCSSFMSHLLNKYFNCLPAYSTMAQLPHNISGKLHIKTEIDVVLSSVSLFKYRQKASLLKK